MTCTAGGAGQRPGWKVPEDINRIFQKRGSEWSRPERDSVWEWLLYKEPQRTHLANFAKNNLGKYGTCDNADDVLSEFSLKKLGGTPDAFGPVITNYIPKEGIFMGYLLRCLGRYCWDYARKLAKEETGPTRTNEEGCRENVLGSNMHQEVKNYEDGEVSPETEIEDTKSGPEETAIKNALMEAVKECIKNLSPTYRDVLRLRWNKLSSDEEIAIALRISHNCVRTRLHRARTALISCLNEKGWTL